MVIFDEFNSANELNLLDKDYAYKLICEYKDKTEIILTATGWIGFVMNFLSSAAFAHV